MFITRLFFRWQKMLLKMTVFHCPKLPQHRKFPHLTVNIPLILYQYISYIVPIFLFPKFLYSYISEARSCLTPCTWVLLAPDGPHVGPMNLAIREVMTTSFLLSFTTICCIKVFAITLLHYDNWFENERNNKSISVMVHFEISSTIYLR